jgi:Peptide N-acetyl-beta-D-glucosaminyl asparaginase amidase A
MYPKSILLSLRPLIHGGTVRPRRSRRTAFGVLVSLLVAAFMLVQFLPGPALAYTPQGNYQSPVTANPRPHPPPTAHCTVTLLHAWGFDNELGNGTAVGKYVPPASCPGPWALVLLDWQTHVKGVQFDRIGTLDIGGVEIFRTINAEPDPRGISWSVLKDVTEYSPVFASSQTFDATMNNYVEGPYTGIIFVNATLTFYEATRAHPAPATPQEIVQAANMTVGAGQASSFSLPSLPDNISSAYLEVYATGHSCDEFWYANAPDSFLSNPYAAPNGICGGTALRGIEVSLDGLPAGIASPFPYLYTGGANPYLWEPIPSPDVFNIPPYVFDVTPFAADLASPGPHSVTITILNNAGYWIVNANLLLFEQSAPTVGALTGDSVSLSEHSVYTVQNLSGNPDFAIDAHFRTQGRASLDLAGYIQSGSGRVSTTVVETYSFHNQENFLLNYTDSQENVTMDQANLAKISVAGPGFRTVETTSDHFAFMLDSGFYQVPQGFHLPTTVRTGYTDNTTELSVGPGGTSFTWSAVSNVVRGHADWIYGSTILPTATTTQVYTSLSSSGALYHHRITAVNGVVTINSLRTRG